MLKNWNNAQYRSAVNRINNKRETYKERVGVDSSTLSQIDTLIDIFNLNNKGGISVRVANLTEEQKMAIQRADAIPTYGERKRKIEKARKKSLSKEEAQDIISRHETIKQKFENLKEYIYSNADSLNAKENEEVMDLLFNPFSRENDGGRLTYNEMEKIIEKFTPNAQPTDPINLFLNED